jgi:hypothetical protein
MRTPEATRRSARRFPRLSGLREHRWSATERAVIITVLAIVMGSLFVTSYSLALGDPVPHRIDAALVGDPTGHARTVDAVQQVARGGLAFHRYASVPAALHAIVEQDAYAGLDLTSTRPTLYLASAAGASVSRVLERISAVDPTVRVVDTHPLGTADPNGVDIFYLMLVTTIVGFFTLFQVRLNAGACRCAGGRASSSPWRSPGRSSSRSSRGRCCTKLDLPVSKSWGILALDLLAVASFTSLMLVLIGRWAVLPTWLFFVVLGNSASGGAVAPPLLPPPFAFVSQWLPSGATVTALREAVYFAAYQHARPSPSSRLGRRRSSRRCWWCRTGSAGARAIPEPPPIRWGYRAAAGERGLGIRLGRWRRAMARSLVPPRRDGYGDHVAPGARWQASRLLGL